MLNNLMPFIKRTASIGAYLFYSFFFFQQCEESIVSLQCGRVSSESFDEIVACTYTGWVFALSTEPIVKPRKDALTTLAPHLEVKVQQVRLTIAKL